jgi:hypothetical protein
LFRDCAHSEFVIRHGQVLFLRTTGGLFALRRFILRLVIWIKQSGPLNYVRFLDYAAGRLFLRKVGGGYIFVHRMPWNTSPC